MVALNSDAKTSSNLEVNFVECKPRSIIFNDRNSFNLRAMKNALQITVK